ncbi:thiamine-phosphate kinase [Cohnella sp.]|uniref:thiamine-phosphate kinase n=1 Tax=Cohnella sp. TaxID=1883426 RepID=UPI0035655588
MPPLDEFGLIRVWTEGRQSKEKLAIAGVTLGIGDDTAIAGGTPGQEWLLTMDTMVEEIHFRNDTMSEYDVGFKAIAANISDIAAMGGLPKLALVSVSVPFQWDEQRMKLLFDGLYACAEQYGVVIVGGDTTSAPQHLVVSVTLIGSVETGKAIRRSGARPGQFIFLTGPTGLSAGGLHYLLARGAVELSSPQSVNHAPIHLIHAHQRPTPSVNAGRILLEKGWGTSLNDVSDGVASEAWEIAEASEVKLILNESQLPISGELAKYAHDNDINPLDWVLYGGEDYVLLGTADKEHEQGMKEHFRAEGIPLFIIGEVEAGKPDVVMETAAGATKPIAKQGYNHFSKG